MSNSSSIAFIFLKVIFKIACNTVRSKSTFVERQFRKAFSLQRVMSNHKILLISKSEYYIKAREDCYNHLRICMRMHLKHASAKAFELWCRVLKLKVFCCLGSTKGLWCPLLERMCNAK